MNSPALHRIVLTMLASLAFTLPLRSQQTTTPVGPPSEQRVQIPATDDGLPGAGPIRRYDWFRRLWTERRLAWAGRLQQDRGAVVLLGDSITQGWGEDFSSYFPGVKIANRGISGDTTRGVLIRLDEDVLALQPAAVVLLIGTNDLEEDARPETAADNLKLIVAKLEGHDPKMPIVLCQVFPSSETKKRPADKIKQLNQLYAAAVKGDPQVILVDTWPLFANAQGNAKAEEFPDLLHPNMAGYVKWAATLRPLLATLGLMETESYQFVLEPGFVSLFNGHDLTGWGYRPTSQAKLERSQQSNPQDAVWPVVTDAHGFDPQPSSPDGRYLAKNGRLIVTTPPEAHRLQQLWTTRHFPGNFILRLEFRASANADSGVFIRQPQLQCRDYLIAGPYKNLKRYKPQDWNELEITVHDGQAQCLCNGELLESAFTLPATGPIGLEGDHGQMEYRRIRVKQTH